MTRFIDLVTNEIMLLLAKNCGRHYATNCKNSDPSITEQMRREIKDIINNQLDTFFIELRQSPRNSDVEENPQFKAYTNEG
jgi:hypothetical protein